MSNLRASSFTTTVPATAPPDGSAYDALYQSLLGFQWRTIGFPVVSFKTTLRQDIIIHKFADRDGAHVEGTGRAAIQVSARIPFVNGLKAGAQETWKGLTLYPGQWRAFFAACALKGSGVLVHPELGPLTCKLETFETDWDAHARRGPSGVATWIESDDTGLELDQALTNPSPLSQVASSASIADDNLANIDPKIVPHLPTFTSTFGDLANSIIAVIDLPSLLENQYGGQVAALIYQANRLEDALNQAGNRSALNWPLFQNVNQMKSSAYDLQQTLITKGRKVGLYAVVGDQSLSQIAQAIPAPITDLMTLNTPLVQNPIVLSGTSVRYYLAA